MLGKVIDKNKKQFLVEIDKRTIKNESLVSFKHHEESAVLAIGEVDAEVGDKVSLEIKVKDKAIETWILYLLPMFLLVVGCILGMIFVDELYIFIGALVGFGLGILAIVIIKNLIFSKQTNAQVYITKVIKEK